VNGAHDQPPIRCWGDGQPTKEMFDGNISTSPQDLLEHLSASSCGLCDPRKAAARAAKKSATDHRYHALLIFPENAPEFVPIATGLLLTNKFRVTILRLHFQSYNDIGDEALFNKERGIVGGKKLQAIHERIVTGIPCDHPVRTEDDASYVLEVNFSIKEQNRFSGGGTICQGPISPQPFDMCAIHAAPGTALLIQNYVPLSDATLSPIGSELPDVLITDASLVGSMMMSEVWAIPTVVVAGPAFVPLAVEHDTAWSSQRGSLLKRLWDLLRQRFQSLAMTKTFMEMNKMRRDFGLPPLRKPIDYLRPVAAIIMEFVQDDSIPGIDATKARQPFVEMTKHWERIHVVGPLQPPCVRCEVKSQSNARGRKQPSNSNKDRTRPTILVIPPSSPTPTWTRTILQGVITAQQSLGRYDDCDWDSLSCQKPYNNFQVVWLEKANDGRRTVETYFPPIQVDSVEWETYSSLLDTLSHHPKTILAMMPCDRDSAILENVMKISVICLEETERFPLKPEQLPPSATEPHELAARILQLLRARQLNEQRASSKSSSEDKRPPTAQGSLTRTVSIIERVVATHHQNYPWRSLADVQRITTQAVKNLTKTVTNDYTTTASEEDEFDWQPPYDTFTVLVAWLVLLTSGIYIGVKDLVPARSIRRRNHYLNNHLPSSASDGLFTRPDLDDAWAVWLEWYHEQPNSLGLLFRDAMGSSAHSSSSQQEASRRDAVSPANNPIHAAGHQVRRRKKR